MGVEQLSDDTFQSHVLDEKNKYVLVDFWAEWCGPCRMLAPTIEAISQTFSEKMNTFKCNTDDCAQAAQSYNIASIPCCILFKDGIEVTRIIGFKSEQDFKASLEKVIA